MKINLVIDPAATGWILGKFTRKMQENLIEKGHDVTITAEPDNTCQINHFIYSEVADYGKTGIDTLMITHVDEWRKWKSLKQRLNLVDAGICMSAHTLRLLRRSGLPGAKLLYINPAHDHDAPLPKILIGFFSNLSYLDDRKRENILIKALMGIDHSPLHFIFMGEGWEEICKKLMDQGVSYTLYSEFEPHTYLSEMKNIDYLLYTGNDEGAMSFLDAVMLNKMTIVTRQGFHRDIAGGITHSFKNAAGLRAILKKISSPYLQRSGDIRLLTWENYCIKHVQVWEYLIAKKNGSAVKIDGPVFKDGLASMNRLNVFNVFLIRDLLFYSNKIRTTVTLVQSLARRFGWNYVFRKMFSMKANR